MGAKQKQYLLVSISNVVLKITFSIDLRLVRFHDIGVSVILTSWMFYFAFIMLFRYLKWHKSVCFVWNY